VDYRHDDDDGYDDVANEYDGGCDVSYGEYDEAFL
jgi:hypothetical protein